MKNCIFLSAMVCLATISSAQTEKGNFLVGGGLSMGRSSQTFASTDVTSTNFSLSPSASYFITNNFAAGLMTSYSYSTSSSESTGGGVMTNSTVEGLGPTVRYYFPVAEKIWVFPQVDYLWNWNRSHFEAVGAPTTDSKSNSQTFRAGAGLAYFIAKNVGLEGVIYYQNLDASSSTTNVTSSINFRVGLQVYILRNKE